MPNTLKILLYKYIKILLDLKFEVSIMEERIAELFAERYIYNYFSGYGYLVIAVKIAVKKQILQEQIDDFLELIAIQSLDSKIKISRCLRRAYTLSTILESGCYYQNKTPKQLLDAIYYIVFQIASTLFLEGYS